MKQYEGSLAPAEHRIIILFRALVKQNEGSLAPAEHRIASKLRNQLRYTIIECDI